MNNLANLTAVELTELRVLVERMSEGDCSLTMQELARAMDLYWGPPVPIEKVTFQGVPCVPAPDVSFSWSFPPTDRVQPISAALGPACHPSMPCGVYQCPTCNGAQAPFYPQSPSTTPAYGSPAMPTNPNPYASYQPKKFATQILPPDQRGSKKPNGGGSKATRAANAERGYRVCAYAEHLNREEGERPGQTFSTPDLSTRHARTQAKASKETFLVLRDGARWKLLKSDGDEVVIG